MIAEQGLRSPLSSPRLAGLGLAGFALAGALALAWFALSLWLALPWLDELAGRVGRLPAVLLIGGIALAPGFMNAFQTASLLLRPATKQVEPAAWPSLSILIAAYNEAPHIARTIDSLFAQHYPGVFEIIVIDDGSTDATASQVRQHFPSVRLVEQAYNQGKAAALNRGLQLARHGLVLTVDADSWLHVDALRLIVREYLNGPSELAAVAGAVFVNNGAANWVTRLQYWDYFHGIAATKRTQAAYGGTLVAQGAFSLYRRDILLDIGGWPPCVGEDIVVTWAMLRRGLVIGYAEEALCFTNVPDSLSSLMRQRTRWARGMIEAFRHHPGVLGKRRLITFLIAWNLLFPWMDFAFTFGFLPGLILACFGHYWLVGPITLALIPSALFIGIVMYRMSARVFAACDMGISRDLPALLAYTFAYGLINHPSSLWGYMAEFIGLRKTWGTK